MATGIVKWFNVQKGYGFIVPDEGGKDIFFHRSQVETQSQILQDNQKVQYDLGQGRKGPEAVKVRPL